MIQKKIDEAANMWNKTRNPKYKERWYKLIEEAYGKDTNYFNTSFRRHISKRATRI
tara:strand:- start:19 stop:186 length:168 start_codon:yes stop_codon:yes gene_type:complete